MIPEQPDHVTTIEHTQDQTTETTADLQPVSAKELRHDSRRKALAKWSQVITWIFFTLEIALGFRVLLKLIAANPSNPFAVFVYQVTRPFVAPFAGLTVTPAVSGAVLEISSLIGMIAYGVLYWLIIRLIWIIFKPMEPGDASRIEPDL